MRTAPPTSDAVDLPRRVRPPQRGRWGAGAIIALTLWALLAHPRLGGEAVGGDTNTTTTTSFSSSVETQTTNETVRVDTFATRLTAVDPIGALVSDQTFPLPFMNPGVQTAIDTAETALFIGPPASLFVKGPTFVEMIESLVGSSTMTVETGRDTTLVVTLENTIGPATIIIGDRNAGGVAFEVLAGTSNVNVNAHNHTVIHELQTTTDTYLATAHYALHGSFLDHFVLYKVKPSKGTPKLAAFGPVTLTDALGGADYDVTKLPGLGLPADKNAEGRADETTHLAQYALKRRKSGAPKFLKRRDVAAATQCGALTLTLTKPESLLVPVAKDLATLPPALDPLSHEVDHLLCYKAKMQKKRSDKTPVATLRKGTQVDAVDQFQTRRYDLKKVTRLCAPVTTAGTPATPKGLAVPIVPAALRHPAGHLVCYQAKVAKKTILQTGCGPVDPKSKGTKIIPKPPKHQKRTGVQLNGPLGTAVLDTAKEIELCIPATAAFP